MKSWHHKALAKGRKPLPDAPGQRPWLNESGESFATGAATDPASAADAESAPAAAAESAPATADESAPAADGDSATPVAPVSRAISYTGNALLTSL